MQMMSDKLQEYWSAITKNPQEDWWKIPNEKVIAIAKKIQSGKALDIACGMGRHTIALAKSGFQVTAFDGSASAVEYTKQWLNSENLKADVREADLISFDYGKNKYDLVLSINAFHHQRESQVRDIARKIEDSLKTGGIFLANFPAFRAKKINEEQAEPQTYIPLEGKEKGIPHFLFQRDQIAEFFPKFKIAETESVYLPNCSDEHFDVVAQKL